MTPANAGQLGKVGRRNDDCRRWGHFMCFSRELHALVGKGEKMIGLAATGVRVDHKRLPTLFGFVLAHPGSKRGQTKEGGCPALSAKCEHFKNLQKDQKKAESKCVRS